MKRSLRQYQFDVEDTGESGFEAISSEHQYGYTHRSSSSDLVGQETDDPFCSAEHNLQYGGYDVDNSEHVLSTV